VLQGHIKVLADVGTLPHHTQHIHGKISWIGIMEAYPLNAFDVGQAFYQFGQFGTSIEVSTVIGKVLGNKLDLFDALSDQ